MNEPKDRLKNLLGEKKFDVEHSLVLYSLRYYSLPAQSIYDEDVFRRWVKGFVTVIYT